MGIWEYRTPNGNLHLQMHIICLKSQLTYINIPYNKLIINKINEIINVHG